MLECLALEDSCIYGMWDWIYENWSWGFFIAVLSLLFTAKALKKTDKSNKLAESSLLAARQSIVTSIQIYENTKEDLIRQQNNLNDIRLKSMKNVIKYEIMTNYVIFYESHKALTKIKDGESKIFIYDKSYNNRLLVFCNDTSTVSGQLELPELKKIHEFLYDSFMLNDHLAKMLVSLLNERLRVDEFFRNLTSLAENMKENKKLFPAVISSMDSTFIRFEKLLDDIFKECDSDNKSIRDMYGNSTKN